MGILYKIKDRIVWKIIGKSKPRFCYLSRYEGYLIPPSELFDKLIKKSMFTLLKLLIRNAGV